MFNAEINKQKEKIWLARPCMHGEELKYMTNAYETNWMTTLGENVNLLESEMQKKIKISNALALSSGTAALHLAIRLAAKNLYHAMPEEKSLDRKQVFCQDLTFMASANPILYEGGEPIFIDSEEDTLNMSPEALEKAFFLYPEVKIVIVTSLYGTPAKMREIANICRKHDAILIEDAAESLGAKLDNHMIGTFGDYNALSFNGNKIITGSTGGMLVSKNGEDIEKAKNWSMQSKTDGISWYQHYNLGFNYRMSNVIAGVVRGQLLHLDEHIEKKKEIYERYKKAFKELPITMNPHLEDSEPNYWLSCMFIDKNYLSFAMRSEKDKFYKKEEGKTCPDEIIDVLKEHNIEARPIWKPMHLQPIFRSYLFVTTEKNSNKSISNDLFDRGLCLPSDINMTEEEQDKVIEIVKECFN